MTDFTSIPIGEDRMLVDLSPANDRAYHEAVEANYYQMEAGRHVARMLDALLVGKPDFVPARDLEFLLAEYRHIAAGLPIDDLASHETGRPIHAS